MGSEADDKTRTSGSTRPTGRVVEDDRGHQIWQGTIDTIKLSLMKTGVFFQSEAQQRLVKLRETEKDDANSDLEQELSLEVELEDDAAGDSCNPYDSSN